jgi:hypothetical protein
VWGKPLQIGDRKFSEGLGTHANSELVFELEEPWERFEAWVGVNAAMRQYKEASVVFKVLAQSNWPRMATSRAWTWAANGWGFAG